MYVWPPQAGSKTEPKVVTKDLGDIRFTDNGEIMVLSFNPKGTTPKQPPSVETLQNPADLNQASQPGSLNGTTSTVPASSTPSSTPPTTAAGETTTTAKPG
jgi:hypothetical protein